MKRKINISAGHNPDGKPGCGAVGLMKESTQARKLLKTVKLIADDFPHMKIRDCTVNNAAGQQDHLEKCAAKHNKKDAVLNIQLHFNSYNGTANGCEVLIKSKSMTALAEKITENISCMGFVNRGAKQRDNLYFLNHVPDAMIIEVCFCDNKYDVKTYKKHRESIAYAILDAIS